MLLLDRNPVFLTLHVRKKIGLPRTFSSGPITSGNHQWALAGNVMELMRKCGIWSNFEYAEGPPSLPQLTPCTRRKQTRKILLVNTYLPK